MEPVLNAVEGLQVASLEEGRIHATVFHFSDVPEVGFRLWRWTKFRDGWRRAQLFQVADIEKLLSLLLQIEDQLVIHPETLQAAKMMSLELREYVPKNLVAVFESGPVRALISDPQKPKPVEPFFALRRTVPGFEKTAHWFYASHLRDLRKTLDQVSNWYQQHSG